MNHELHHRGFALFQSSYRQENGTPGHGAVGVQGPRPEPGVHRLPHAHRRHDHRARHPHRPGPGAGRGQGQERRHPGRQGAAGGCSCSPAPATARAAAAPGPCAPCRCSTTAGRCPWTPWPGRRCGRSPAPPPGRARIPWTPSPPGCSIPPAAANAPVVKVGSASFARELGLPAGTTHASFQALAQNPKFLELIQAARQAQQRGPAAPRGPAGGRGRRQAHGDHAGHPAAADRPPVAGGRQPSGRLEPAHAA